MINEGVQQELRTEVDRNILSKQDVMSLDYHYGMHIMGTSWTNAGDGPITRCCATGTNWDLAYCEPRLIPLLDLIVNVDVACLPTTATCG